MRKLLYAGAVALALWVSACDISLPADFTPPGTVTMASANFNSTTLTLHWTDPTDADLATIRIEWKAGGDTAYTSTDVVAGAETVTINGTYSVGAYNFRLSSVDNAGNRSAPVVFALTLIAAAPEFHFIYTAEQLNAVRGAVSGDYTDWSLADGYCLMNDISLASYADGAGWVPLGEYLTNFTGVFEGNGHTVSNLTINSSDLTGYGLFGIIHDPACITSLHVTGSIQGSAYVGGLVGNNTNGTIIDCHAAVNVVATV